ncbi:hypothetical protein [Deinococcus aquaticus]|uniref:Terminase large subunit gp17-like C-terminal domain-containing protein n=1 Tax=Deinococcus aquaticus TaxID=328692 RepID=A0ABY7UZ28_9DEIO|nr:hypothetical protein [Deinococcus aquaticus]WDA58157.1 hypothetical protein M8445_12480 [Deinococcus aquaticus]
MDNIKITQQQRSAIIREAGRRDIVFFQRNILKTPEEFIRPHQKVWLESFENYSNVLLLAPREHLKSSTLTTYLLHKVLYNPEIRILIVTISDSLATGMLQRIKSILETNTTIRQLFGDVKGNGVWGADGLTLKRKNIYTEPTIKAIGIGTAAVGSRCDLLICDDLIDSTKADSPTERDKLSERFNGELSSLVSDGGKTIVLGTRKGAHDLYSELLDNKSYYCLVQPAITSHRPEDLTCEYIRDSNGVITGVEIAEEVAVLDPVRWPIERLMLRRINTGSTRFLREYQNDISSFTGNLLKPEWLTVSTVPPIEQMNLYMGVDLAISDKTNSDFTVITTVGVDKKTNRIYLLKMHRSRSDFPTTIENIKSEYQSWHIKPLKVTVESNAAQMATFQMLFRNTHLPVFPSHTSKGKDIRMQLLAPLFESGKIQLSHGFDSDGIFRNEWASFPSMKVHDDALDSVEIALRPILKQSSKGAGRVITSGIR